MTYVATWVATLGLFGCVQIDGGAVELSWTIRDSDGVPRGCGDIPLARVRLCWEPVSDTGVVLDCDLEGSPDDPPRNAVFSCADLHGVTTFEIEPGATALWIEPLCEDRQVPPNYVVPAAIVRDIANGEVAILNALLIVADQGACQR